MYDTRQKLLCGYVVLHMFIVVELASVNNSAESTWNVRGKSMKEEAGIEASLELKKMPV